MGGRGGRGGGGEGRGGGGGQGLAGELGLTNTEHYLHTNQSDWNDKSILFLSSMAFMKAG